MWSADQAPLSQEAIAERLGNLAAVSAPGLDVELRLTEGPASPAVLAVSEAVGADVVVPSTHHLHSDDHASVTTTVLERTHRLVLALHDDHFSLLLLARVLLTVMACLGLHIQFGQAGVANFAAAAARANILMHSGSVAVEAMSATPKAKTVTTRRWGDFRGGRDEPALMRVAGGAVAEGDRDSFETPTSMRNVDVECGADVVARYLID